MTVDEYAKTDPYAKRAPWTYCVQCDAGIYENQTPVYHRIEFNIDLPFCCELHRIAWLEEN